MLAGSAQNATFSAKGALWHFPFHNDEQGVFALDAHVMGGILDYADNWQRAENIDARLSIRGTKIEAHVASATIAGVPMTSYEGITDQAIKDVFEFTRKSGAEVIRLKGGAGRAVGISIKEVVEAIARDSHQVLPVSSVQSGKLGISDISLSLPTVVGRKGVVEVVEPVVSAEEKELLLKSAASLKEIWVSIN